MKKEKEFKEIEVVEAEPINVLSTIKASALIDVSSWKEKQLKLVAENPFFEITDNKTYEAGKKHRTNVVKGRTELQNQDKLVASKFAAIRKEVGTETATLIEITQPLEDQWQEEVKAWEERKAKQKEEEEAAEALRVKTINYKIDETETSCYEIIQKMTFSEIDFSKTQLFAFFTVDFDFEEYDILFEQVKSRVETVLEQKIDSLTVSENQRLDNIRLEAENAEAKRVSYLQASRLTEIMPYVAFGASLDLTKLGEMDNDEYEGNLSSKKGLFDADAENKQKEQEVFEEKAKADKEAIFEIRKNRILEIYPNFDVSKEFVFYGKTDRDIFKCDAIEFETILNEAKYEIDKIKSDAKELEEKKLKKITENKRRELLFEEAGMPLGENFVGLNFNTGPNRCFTVEAYQIFESTDEQFAATLTLAKEAFFKYRSAYITELGYVYNQVTKNFEMDGFDSYSDDFLDYKSCFFNERIDDIKEHVKDVNEKLAIADAAKLKLDNKARIEKYASDKKQLKAFVKSLEFRNAVPELKNEDMQVVLDKVIWELENCKGFLLTEINVF
jgi:hypothetical protein